ncbi:glycosyltransferase family 4 protein [Pseudanabaena sp. FACHB-1277]|uniref:Glycosyltransferase family 4 protein n=1 Tax=Pseudanabaena cinerea FACHB-1277 TaxID=2949581 RepID=A0A926Z735_9CYAN|nr:glycosyltransferase family 4 protein [Pseudanabaena cinerea]MBD2149419.1 glycosyltransferase family 4 protein [Pseudanabaena cinerea FACHB-1277]
MYKVHHCGAGLALAGGGIKSYVDGLLTALPEMGDRHLITSLANLDQSQYDLLHIHEGTMLADLTGQCPAVYTLHNHDSYCPSGTKYLTASQKICDRQMSYLGCTWGQIVDGCGSRRPEKILAGFQRAYSNLELLQKLGITVIANSDYVRSQLIFNGLAPEQVVTLRCGIISPRSPHEPLTKTLHQRQRILFASRIVPEKGLDWLLRSLSYVDSQIHLDIAGEGWDLPRMRKLAEQLKLGDRLTWHGWCDQEKLEDLYHQSMAVVFPSVWPEPAGLITLEAYARFRPIIASAVGGIPEHMRDRTGILVKPNDEQALAAAINDLAHNFEKSQAIGIAGHQLFEEEFTLSIHAAKLTEIYDAAIAKFCQ